MDRGKAGSTIHALSDRAGLPLALGVSAANTHDNHALKPRVKAIPAIRSRRGPRRARPTKLHADNAYDVTKLRRRLRQRAIAPRIARKGVESSTTLGKHRWVIERSIAWLFGYRRLTIRYERHAHLILPLPHPRRRTHLLQKTRQSQMRHALKYQDGWVEDPPDEATTAW